jgi:predicted aspartyl protease
MFIAISTKLRCRIICMMTSTRYRLLALLAAALVAGPAFAEEKPACQYVQLAKVPLHYTGPSLGITMDGTINGTPAVMLADSGAHQTFLTRTGTEKRGLKLWPATGRVQGVGGMSALYTARIDGFAAGPAKSSKGWVNVIGDTGRAPWFEAIVGAPFLLQTDMELSVPEKEIRFYKPIGCQNAWLAYWDRNAVVIPFERNNLDRLPVNPVFTVEINGQKLDALIDSGASRTTIDSRAAQRIGIRLDGPDVVRNGSAYGVGERRIAHWHTRVASFKIGDEIIRDADINIMDTRGQLDVDVLIGDDFLRAHRVLFAMSQKKIYFSYTGGDVFGKRQPIEPWVQKEADEGNPDAQMVVALSYQTGKGVPKDPQRAAAWLNKAAAQGHPQANLALGRELMLAGRFGDAIARIKPALDKLPAERYGALWLYLARLRAGERDTAGPELQATFARSEDNAWPGPIADYYLSRIDAAALLSAAGRNDERAAVQTCQAKRYMAEREAALAGTAAPAATQEVCDPEDL